MKLMLNGAVTLGTYDGANIEIFEQAEPAADGEEARKPLTNNFVFGATVEELNAIKADYDPEAIYGANPRLARVIDALDEFEKPEDADVETPVDEAEAPADDAETAEEAAEAPALREGDLAELKQSLLKGASWHKPDHYFILKDYPSYMEAKLAAIRATRDPVAFAKMALHNIAGAGKFSSDRTIREYWDELWSK